jgi:structural hemagglutinin/hemolysin toxin protein RtxA
MQYQMEISYLIYCYVPISHLEEVKTALFEAGAGKIGNYEHCCWQTLGHGQFRPLAQANPAIGTIFETNTIEEYKIEIICQKDILETCIQALKNAHPYEEPAYQILEFRY